MEEFDINILKRKMLRKYPAFGSVISSVKYEIVDNSSGITTAGTNGKKIVINKDFMNKLTEKEQIFILAHEICHIAFQHIERSKDKNQMLWNIATDAIINKNLEQDGLPIPEGGINREDALNYDAEELYELLLKEQQEKMQQMQGSGQGQSEQQSDGSSGNNSGEQQNQQQQQNNMGHDDHGMWKEALENSEEEQNQSDGSDEKDSQGINKTDSQEKDNSQTKQNPIQINEKDIFKSNREQVEKRAEEIISKINSQSRGLDGEAELASVGNVGSAKHPVVNWKKILRKELEIESERWGYRFSDKGNHFSPRLEDYEYEESAQTEIILDTSGSVSIGLLKSFLRQIKTILKQSKIKVATFSSEFHNNWQEIKTEKDIDNLKLYIGGGTNFDAASRAFSKDPRVNKICFTDGQDGGDALIMNKRKDIIWISFVNKYFKPDNGKVIFVPPSEINKDVESFKKQDELEMVL